MTMLTITKVSENDEQIDELSDDTAEEFTDESTDNTDAETNGLNEEFSNETGEETVDDSIEDDSTEYAEIQEIKEGYFEDLRGSSEYPNTIVDNGKDWERRDIVENAGMRDEFDSIKGDLISEWEAIMALNGLSMMRMYIQIQEAKFVARVIVMMHIIFSRSPMEMKTQHQI